MKRSDVLAWNKLCVEDLPKIWRVPLNIDLQVLGGYISESFIFIFIENGIILPLITDNNGGNLLFVNNIVLLHW